jgi:hypothetical protein
VQFRHRKLTAISVGEANHFHPGAPRHEVEGEEELKKTGVQENPAFDNRAAKRTRKSRGTKKLRPKRTKPSAIKTSSLPTILQRSLKYGIKRWDAGAAKKAEYSAAPFRVHNELTMNCELEMSM